LAAKVSTVPGSLKVLENEDECVSISREIGYPVMIKASAGGGGKGMRVAHNDQEARSGFRLSTDEARSSFGDTRVFVEKFVEVPRHIEVQVMGDNHGNVVALPERECSIQRRNQKVLEEAPSSFLDAATRARMQQQAVDLAKAVSYNSAGTVEFLCDKNRNFYFLEMNTRLQVEHPITELVTGVDLVEQMIRVAAGHKLPQDWLDRAKPGLPFKGWAHEARVYAEDPVRGFLPSIGRLTTYIEPASGPSEGVRCDTGVVQGSEISMFYDPMICKLCTYAPTRLEGLEKLEVALDNYVIQGVRHNIPFLRDVIRDARFKEGRLSTNYIPEQYPNGFVHVNLTNDEKIKLAAISAHIEIARQEKVTSIGDGEFDIESEFFIAIEKETFKVTVAMETGETMVTPTGSPNPVLVNIQSMEWIVDSPIARPEIDGKKYPVQYHARLPLGYRLQMCGATLDVIVRNSREQELSKFMLEKKTADTSRFLISPMPGVLVSVSVKPGDKVFAGQNLCVVEAMKMQNNLQSPKAGTVKSVFAKPGQSLAVDENIIEFE